MRWVTNTYSKKICRHATRLLMANFRSYPLYLLILAKLAFSRGLTRFLCIQKRAGSILVCETAKTDTSQNSIPESNDNVMGHILVVFGFSDEKQRFQRSLLTQNIKRLRCSVHESTNNAFCTECWNNISTSYINSIHPIRICQCMKQSHMYTF